MVDCALLAFISANTCFANTSGLASLPDENDGKALAFCPRLRSEDWRTRCLRVTSFVLDLLRLELALDDVCNKLLLPFVLDRGLREADEVRLAEARFVLTFVFVFAGDDRSIGCDWGGVE